MSTQCRVVYTGQLKPGIDAERAAREFAAVFKVPEDKARKLVLGGAERVLKQDVDAANAERYRGVLEEIGLVARVDCVDTGRPDPTGIDGGASTPESKRGSTGAFAMPDARDAARGASEGAASRPAADPLDVDPYAPPGADLTGARATAPADDIMTGPHAVPASHGWQWITAGFELFMRAALSWIGAVVLLGLFYFLVSLVPVVGGLIGSLIGPVLLGGLMLGADALARGGRFRVGDLFAGFSGHSGRLLTVGALYLGAVLIISLASALLLGILAVGVGGLDPAVLEQQDPTLVLATLGPMLLLTMLFLLLLLVPVIMAYWFAPALVVLEDMPPVAAMKLSFAACWRNVLPFLVYGLVTLILLAIGTFTLGIGLLIVGPVLTASVYTGYRDIFYQ